MLRAHGEFEFGRMVEYMALILATPRPGLASRKVFLEGGIVQDGWVSNGRGQGEGRNKRLLNNASLGYVRS